MSHLSTLDNVIVGQHSRVGGWRGALHPVNLVPGNRWREQAMTALADAGLSEYAHTVVGALPYGVQKRIEVVRALMANPSLLLLDEPAAGLNPAETEALQVYLDRLSRDGGLTLLVVEHDMHFIGALCRDVVVLSFGKKIAEGSPESIRENPHVQEVYLGAPVARPVAPEDVVKTEYRRVAQGA
jgi:ABC-type branched-subunit amino acid transport system ATPase component